MAETKGPSLFDTMFIPALLLVKTARIESQFDGDEEALITRIAREVLDETIEELRVEAKGNEEFAERTRLMVCPAQDEFDRLTLDMLVAQLPLADWEIRRTAVATLTAELLADAAEFDPQVIVIGSLPPGGVAHARYLAKRLRAKFPNAQILVGRWGDTALDTDAWKNVGADSVASTLEQGAQYLSVWKPVLQAREVATSR